MKIKVYETFEDSYQFNDSSNLINASVFQVLYDELYKNWLDYEDGYDALEQAFDLGVQGKNDWAIYMGGRGNYETPDYIDVAFNAGCRYRNAKSDLDFLADEIPEK